MKESSDRVIDVVDELAIPPEREMPPGAMQARKHALLLAIAEDAHSQPASVAERIQVRLRTMLSSLGLLALFFAVLVAASVVAVSGSGNAKRVAELTAVTGAAAVIAAPALAASGSAHTGVHGFRFERRSLAPA